MSDAVQRGSSNAGPQSVAHGPGVRTDGRENAAAQSNGTAGALPEKLGRYRIIRFLGKGAMGSVYLAHDTQLDRQVAMKVPKFEEGDGADVLERFYREARSAAILRHPNICPVYDVGEIDGNRYLTMAYIEGRPLTEFIKRDKPLAERQVAILVRKLALALNEAHTHGIIHRDLKPGNVMIDQHGEPVILDFGLARNVDRGDTTRLTQVGVLLGSPAYMSPEQVEADDDTLGPATDIYSLGVVLYELLTGRVPFAGSAVSVIACIMTREPPPLKELRPTVDPRLDAICQKMMAKRIAERFASMTAVADALAGFLKRPAAGGHVPPAPSATPPTGTPAAPTASTVLRINEDEVALKDDSDDEIAGSDTHSGAGEAGTTAALRINEDEITFKDDDSDRPAASGTSSTDDAASDAAADKATDSQIRKLERQRAAVVALAKQHRYGQAGRLLQSMASLKDARLARFAQWARKSIPRLKAEVARLRQQGEAAMQQAQEAILQNDYEAAVARLKRIPGPCRTEVVQCLLDRALELANEVKRLLADVEHAIEHDELDDIQPKLKRLLRLKPNDPRVQAVCKQARDRIGK